MIMQKEDDNDNHKDNHDNHNYNKIVKSDWLSTALISALIGQFNRTVRLMPFFTASKTKFRISCVLV